MVGFNSVNLAGDTPLHVCANTGHLLLGERLLSIQGLNVNIQNRKDETALFVATVYDHLSLVHLLTQAGASPHLTDESGQTALDVAASPEVLALLRDRVRELKASSVSPYARSSLMQKQHSMGAIPPAHASSSAASSSSSAMHSAGLGPGRKGSVAVPYNGPVGVARPNAPLYHDAISLSSSVPSGLGATRDRSGSISSFGQQARHRLLLMDEELHHSSSSSAAGGFAALADPHGGTCAAQGDFSSTASCSATCSTHTCGAASPNASSSSAFALSGSPGSTCNSNSANNSNFPNHASSNSAMASSSASADDDCEMRQAPEDSEQQVDRLGDELVEELGHILEDTFLLDAIAKITSSRSFRWKRTYSRTKIEVLKWLADYVGDDEEAQQPFLRHLKASYPEAIKLTFVRTSSAKKLSKKERSQKKLLMVERKIKAYEWELTTENVSVLETIGVGSYGSVSRARLVTSEEEVAVKMLASDVSHDDAAIFLKEISILSRLSHPSIVGFVGAIISGTLALVMEYCALGNLKQFLQQRLQTSWLVKIRMARQAAEGIAYLHAQNPPIVHRDLKCQNILVTRDGDVKVSDFGISKTISRTMGNASKMGTLNWLAPEVLRGEEIHNTAVDVYAFGMVLYEILMDGKPPYESWQPLQIVRAIDEGQQPNIPDFCDEHYKSLVQMCWTREAQDRPSMHYICERLGMMETETINALTVGGHQMHLHNKRQLSSQNVRLQAQLQLQQIQLNAKTASPPVRHGSGSSNGLQRIDSQPEVTSAGHSPATHQIASPRANYASSMNNTSPLFRQDSPLTCSAGSATSSVSSTSSCDCVDSTSMCTSHHHTAHHASNATPHSSVYGSTSPSPRGGVTCACSHSPTVSPRSASVQLTHAPPSPTKSSPKLRKKDSSGSNSTAKLAKESSAQSDQRSGSLQLRMRSGSKSKA